jgi:pimeloyl-ACP methyl ester carboxylesterase
MPYAETAMGTLYYEVEGDPADPPVLLIAGQGAQLISWPPQLRDLLLGAGLRVIVFDNRDSGLSSGCEEAPAYEIADMVRDVSELLDAVGVPRAHIVGQSMGGMIAQDLALDHPEKVLSLCSIYSAPNPSYITTDLSIWAVRETMEAADRESAIRQYIQQEAIAGLEEYSSAWIRNYAEHVIDRAYRPEGALRQLAAVRRRPDRTGDLANIAVPSVVLHGLEDRLIHYQGGLDTAAAIPDAELHLYAKMGHQLLPSLLEDYARIITRNCMRSTTHQPQPLP